MRSCVLLLLAVVLTTPLRPGSAEGDPLPPSLVDLVRNSPISSVDDLKLLLQQDTSAQEEEEDEHDAYSNPTHARYVRSLQAEVQPAQQAVCKTRTEVMELSRSMVDRRNTNFLLWPPCVEVQRCSGCCNTRVLQCVPVVTSSRYLQVLKIQYINHKARYDRAVISVEDHVSCRCQTASPISSSSSTVLLSTTQSNPGLPLSQSQQLPPSSRRPSSHSGSSKTQASKADLHRHDDLKHNQQHQRGEERESQRQQGSYTQLVHWTLPRAHQYPAQVQPAALQTTTELNKSWPSEARAEQRAAGHGSGCDGSREETNSDGDVQHPDHAQRQQQLLQHQQRQDHSHYPQQHSRPGAQHQELTTHNRLYFLQSDSAFPPPAPTQPPSMEGKPSGFSTAAQRDSVTVQKDKEVTANGQTETEGVALREGSEREESGSTHNGDSVDLGKEKDSTVSGERGHLTEEERRRKLLEIVQKEPQEPSLLHLRHQQQRPRPAQFKTAVPTVASMLASTRQQTPFRPASPRRRRKHRKRISKAAMRAMIM